MSSPLGATEEKARVVAAPWPLFLRWLQATWEPGQHLALVGPTGEGKTTFAVGVLSLRKWVMAIDAKGEDDTLAASGYTRITSLPLPRKMRNDIAEGKPARIIVGGPADTEQQERRLRELNRQAIEMVRGQGGWTIYCDEFQILSDMRMFNLGKPVEKLLIAARRKKTSVVTSFQAPAWVPKAATRQAWGVVLWPTRDRDMIKNTAQAMGRDYRELEEIVDQLPQYHPVVIPKSIHAPFVLTVPPKIN